MGMARTRDAVASADIVLSLQDADTALVRLEKGDPLADASTIVGIKTDGALQPLVMMVWTKADLLPLDNARARELSTTGVLTSTVTGIGLDLLWKKLGEAAGREKMRQVAAMGVMLNHRHQLKLIQCRDCLTELVGEIEKTAPGEEVVASILATVLADLGEISGRVYTEQLLDDIFSRFCVGK
jgi:tRNA modification GTPase